MTGALCCEQVSHVQSPENWRLVETAKIIYSAGFFMTSSPETMKLVSEYCCKNNTIYCLVMRYSRATEVWVVVTPCLSHPILLLFTAESVSAIPYGGPSLQGHSYGNYAQCGLPVWE